MLGRFITSVHLMYAYMNDALNELILMKFHIMGL